ncbi:hypothetical protein SCHPADRAFT_237180 [Schizopora paradoxa]|uniref:Uncharacterized protein n=1 Tax=Schizopora paradoxa TaxID=27342 RepID=A0A0H2RVD3_9AGAM|nr:hypothetical protein SCHPADRAFT_237180 [Schizopora paradoxa]
MGDRNHVHDLVLNDKPDNPRTQFLYDDVLHNIFLLGLPSNVANHPHGSFMLNVSQVCRVWRNVALSDPNLWTELVWDPFEDRVELIDKPNDEKMTLLYRHYLSRSQDLPLSIDIHSPSLNSSTSFHQVLEMTLSMPVQRRLRQFSICCEDVDLDPTRSYMIINAPLLESLVVDIVDTQTSGGEFFVDISLSPRLRTIYLTGQVRLSTNYTRTPPQASLTGLTLLTTTSSGNYWMRGEILLELLRRFPSLDTITFDLQVDTVRVDTFQRPALPFTVAPNLVSMHLRFNENPISTANEIFKRLDLPKLHKLILDYNFSPIHLFNLLHTWSDVKCLRKLEDLTIHYGFTEEMAEDLARDEEIVSLLRLTPSLINLAIRDVPLSGRILDALATNPKLNSKSDSPRTELVCPNLEFVIIESADQSFGQFPIPASAEVGLNKSRHYMRISLPSSRHELYPPS